MARAIREGAAYATSSRAGRGQVVQTFEELIEGADMALDPVVGIRPHAKVIVAPELAFGGGGRYVPSSMDGTRSGAFHTGVGEGSVRKFSMPSLAHHETIPGHHFQIAIAKELDLPLLRNAILFNGYAEGWALAPSNWVGS